MAKRDVYNQPPYNSSSISWRQTPVEEGKSTEVIVLDEISAAITTSKNNRLNLQLSQRKLEEVHKIQNTLDHAAQRLLADYRLYDEEKRLRSMVLTSSSSDEDEEKKLLQSAKTNKALDEIDLAIEGAEFFRKKIIEELMLPACKLWFDNYSLSGLQKTERKAIENLFSDLHILHRISEPQRALALSFAQEQLINRLIAREMFLRDVRKTIESKKSEIIHNFYPSQDAELEKIIAETQFKLELLDSETHNKGKVPVKVIFALPGNTQFEVVYKPRSAN